MTHNIPFDRVILGTVQLGVPYGRKRRDGLMPEPVAFALLDAAWNMGIRRFDTAEGYGVSADRLARWLGVSGRLNASSVVTKVVPAPSVWGDASHAMSRFTGAGELTLLSHGVVKGETWLRLKDAAAAVGAAVGQSVYERAEVLAAWGLAGARVVQAPANVFTTSAMIEPEGDQRETHYRSVYLQGLLLESPSDAELRVAGSGRLAAAVRAAANRVGWSPAPLLVAAVLRAGRASDRVVVGVDNADDLEPLALALTAPTDIVDEFARQLAGVPMPGRDVMDPRRWVTKP